MAADTEEKRTRRKVARGGAANSRRDLAGSQDRGVATALWQCERHSYRKGQGPVGSFRRAILKGNFLAKRSERLHAAMGKFAIEVAGNPASSYPRRRSRSRMARRDASYPPE